MPGKHLDLDLNSNLGGENPSDVYIASQRAVKTYVDGSIETVNDKIDAIQVVDELRELQDVVITNAQNGNSLVYDSTARKWKNSTINTTTSWGGITGTLSNQTDLQSALNGKANTSHTHVMADITNLSIPTKTSDLTNDSGFITTSALSGYAKTTDLPENVSELTNDAGYITSASIPTKLSQLTDDLGASPTHTHSQYQTTISDLSTIRSGATAGSTAIQPGDNISKLVNDAGYLTSEDISSVFVYQGTKATVGDLPSTGNKKGDVWTVSADGSEYVWDGSAWQYLGEILDLSGYQTLLSTTNKLNPSYINTNASNRFVTDTEKSTWNNKQNAISDLSTIRSGAEAGATALQPSDNISELINDAGYLTEHQDISGKQDKDTAVTHTKNTAVGNTITPVYVNSSGVVTALSYTIAKSVPSDAKFSDTTYTAGSGLSLSGTQFKHSNSITAGTVGTSTASSGSTLSVPYVTYNATGHITATGNRTHTVTGFITSHQDISGKADKATTLSGYGITDAYTKTEIDGKLTSAMHYKGTVATVAALDDITSPATGDVYNVTATGDNYAWDGSAWDKLAGTIDLSSYQLKNTAVTHTANTAVGNTITPVYINSSGVATALSYTIAKSVPADANFSNTTYSAGTGLSLSGTTFNHTSSVTAATQGTSVGTSGSTLAVPYVTYNASGHITAAGTHTHTVTGFATSSHTHSNYQSTSTAVTHTASTAVGNTITPVYIASNGAATALSYTIAKSVPADAKFSDTTYSEFTGANGTTAGKAGLVKAPAATDNTKFLKGDGTWATPAGTIYTAGAGLSLSGTEFKHANSITAGTVGTSTASSGSTLTVPYVTYNATGHITATGTRTHTVSGFSTTDTKNTAGSTDTSSKIFLVGATSQAANPQTYSHDTAFVDTDGALNSVTPAKGNNTTKVATTAFVTTAVGSYVKKAGDTMTGALNFANNVWNNMGDDAAIGDCNVGGHIGIKQLNGSSCGFQFYNSSGTALAQLNANSGNITSSGSLGLSNNAAKMQYNSTTQAIEFVFA